MSTTINPLPTWQVPSDLKGQDPTGNEWIEIELDNYGLSRLKPQYDKLPANTNAQKTAKNKMYSEIARQVKAAVTKARTAKQTRRRAKPDEMDTSDGQDPVKIEAQRLTEIERAMKAADAFLKSRNASQVVTKKESLEAASALIKKFLIQAKQGVDKNVLIKELSQKQIDENKLNGRAYSFGLEFVSNAFEYLAMKDEGSAPDFQQISDFVTGRLSEAQAAALSENNNSRTTATDAMRLNSWLPVIVRDPDENLMEKYKAVSRTDLKNKLKTEYGSKVADAVLLAQLRWFDAYSDNFIVGPPLDIFKAYADQCWFHTIHDKFDVKQMGKTLANHNYRRNEWKKATWCTGTFPLVNIQMAQGDVDDPGNSSHQPFITGMMKTFSDQEAIGDRLRTMGSELLEGLLSLDIANDFKDKQEIRSGYTVYSYDQTMRVNVIKKAEFEQYYSNTDVYANMTTIMNLMTISESWMQKYYLMIHRGYQCFALSVGLKIKNLKYKTLFVVILKRMGAVEETPIYALTYGGSVTLKVSDCDLDDQIFLVGIQNRRQEILAFDMRKLTGFEGAYDKDAVLESVQQQAQYGTNSQRFATNLTYDVKFSGFFQASQNTPLFEANANTFRLPIREFRSKQTKAQIGTIKSGDSSVFFSDAFDVIEDFDEDFSGTIDKVDPSQFASDSYQEFEQLKATVNSQNASTSNKLYRLAILLKSMKQSSTDKFKRDVGDYLKSKGLGNLKDGANSDYTRQQLQKQGVDLTWLNSIAEKMGMVKFLTESGAAYVKDKVSTEGKNSFYRSNYSMGNPGGYSGYKRRR